MKKILYLLLAIVSVLGLAGCKPTPTSQLWAMNIEVDHHTATQIMEDMSLYPEELSLVIEPLYTTVFLRFNKDGTFEYYKDPEAEKQCVRDFFHGVFDALYEGRNYLSETYQMDFSNSTKEDFIRFYTDLYSVLDYDALIEKCAASAYDYTSFGKLTSGTYTQKDGVITLDADDNNYDDTAEFTIADNQLTLCFVDRTEVYSLVTEE